MQLSLKADQDKMILGLKIFNEKGNCASCHQLAKAKSVGDIGPSLDDLKPTQAQVKQAVINGIGMLNFHYNSNGDSIEFDSNMARLKKVLRHVRFELTAFRL